MATHLTIEALNYLHKNPDLQKQIAPFMGVGEGGVKSAIMRSSVSLTTWKAVEAIAKSMDKEPSTILEESND